MTNLEVPYMDIALVGIGGQGNILASDLLGEVGLAAGYDVKKADTFGMAQRGGSVISLIRLGATVFSPLPRMGHIDVLIALEKLEAARGASWLRPGGLAVINDYALPPLSVSSGTDRYPTDEEVTAALAARTDRLYFVPGSTIARKIGNPRVANVAVLGFVAAFLPIDRSIWRGVLVRLVPVRHQETNLDALDRGWLEGELARESVRTKPVSPYPTHCH